jgi:hypothetical protein
MHTVVHVTHEAVHKIGGIGAVLHGLITSKSYRSQVGRDILLGPLFSTDGPMDSRLHGGTVLYSGVDGYRNTPFANDFARIEHDFGVKLIYGKKTFHDPLTGITSEPEVLLVDVRHYNPEKMGVLKFVLFKDYGIDSAAYEHIWDYEQYCRIAEPGLEAIRAIGGCEDEGNKRTTPIILAHEYMGMPTALAARSRYPGQFRSIFYAHEVATMRRIVEDHPGHDTMFYNVLEKAQAKGQYVEDVFGSQKGFYKHPLVEASRFCDNIFAVGDYVVKELRFLRKEFKDLHIDTAYNGVPARSLTVEERQKSRQKLRQYCTNVLNFQPDFVFTHLTRLVPSKGLWRDIKVVEQLEKHLAKDNKTAVLFIGSTETIGRQPHDIQNMEKNYKWPAAHREGHPDLTGGEAYFYAGVQEWNAKARFCKILFLNTFIINAATLGHRAPADIDFLDFRKGSDAEFGQSIYEPFGIAQVEPISFGGICVFTSLCGCAGFVHKAAGEKPTPNAIPVDYTRLPESMKSQSIPELLTMTKQTRDELEQSTAAGIAEELYKRLPRSLQDFEKLIATGGQLGKQMSWDAVATNYVLPGLTRALNGKGGA